MILFVLTFFTIYGGVHWYAFIRARHALALGTGAGAALAGFMLAMVAAPFLVRAVERLGYELAARALSYVAYCWMAALFLFFCFSLSLDLANLIARTARWAIRSDFSAVIVSARTSFFLCLGFSLIACVYGYFEALDVRTERLRIETVKLPAGIDRLTIVQISDVHLGMIVRCSRMKNILDLVKAEKPDIFVSTGDLVDAQINHLTGLADLLQEVKPKYGKYAVTGNHEFFAGLNQALQFTRDAGFTMLRDQAQSDGPVSIAGVDDPAGIQLKVAQPMSEKALLAGLPKEKFTLLLKHQPRLDPEAEGLFDLQLSGHTHRGQIYPFRYISGLVYPLNAGRYDLAKGSILYVSRGTGTWGPPMRFFAPPQITVIELVRK